MVLPSVEALANGLTATLIIVTGYLIAIRLLIAIRQSGSKLLPAQALFAFCLGSFYLGSVISFWVMSFTGYNLQPDWLGNLPPYSFVGILDFTVSPIGVCAAMYIGFSMIKPKIVKPMVTIYAITAIPFWANLWFNWLGPSQNIPAVGAGNLVDIGLLGLSGIFTAVYILSLILIAGGGFIYLAKISTGEIKRRSTFYAIGIMLFSLAGITETQVHLVEMGLSILLVVIRLVMVGAYIILYKAMIPPKQSFPPVHD
ncbi:MAG TPA: hypothetical protein VKM55_02445 [Candidatus Lokiarchaeia archaeon]|nr:hypothetical protein [Candidatus Lokiarchaeia archaeon]